MKVIVSENVSFRYEHADVLKDLTLTVEDNSFWAIVGPNGSGKSTFLSLLSGQLEPRQGRIMVQNKDVRHFTNPQRARILSVVRQEFVPVFGFTVREVVMMACFNRRTSMLFEDSRDTQAVEAALKATDTADFADRPLAHLSGGERQRVFIARALAQETPILLLDEPTSHLDLKHQVRIFDLLKQMQAAQGKTILLVTHDINLACQYCDRVLLLGTGGTYFQGSPQEVLDVGRIRETFSVKGYQGLISREKFFMPLGEFSKDRPCEEP